MNELLVVINSVVVSGCMVVDEVDSSVVAENFNSVLIAT